MRVCVCVCVCACVCVCVCMSVFVLDEFSIGAEVRAVKGHAQA